MADLPAAAHQQLPLLSLAISSGIQAVKLLLQNPSVLNWECKLTQIDVDNGHEVVVYAYVDVLSHT